VGWEYRELTGPAAEELPKIQRIVATADGWIGSLSGGTGGASFGLGWVYARSPRTVYGRHVFGWVPTEEGQKVVTGPV
jgi:hypothetical protein